MTAPSQPVCCAPTACAHLSPNPGLVPAPAALLGCAETPLLLLQACSGAAPALLKSQVLSRQCQGGKCRSLAGFDMLVRVEILLQH